MRISQIFSVIVLLISQSVFASWTPRADYYTTNMFLSGSPVALPDIFFQTDPVVSDSYLLKKCFYVGMSSCSPSVLQYSSWNSSNLASISYPGYYNEYNSGYPSISEYQTSRGQCVAFAKAATNTELTGTYKWKRGQSVESSYTIGYDNSYMLAGMMIAYFDELDTYPQGQTVNGRKRIGHVGMFLKYQYSGPVNSLTRPIGFWILDENYNGNDAATNPDGKIRKHLMIYGSGSKYKNASNYNFVLVD